MKKWQICGVVTLLITGCASLTNDAFIPVALSFSNGKTGTCDISNKRFSLSIDVPSTPMVRRSDDVLKYTCVDENGSKSFGSIPSTIGAKIVASAIFLDLGIVDSITDKHREYPSSFVIPIK